MIQKTNGIESEFSDAELDKEVLLRRKLIYEDGAQKRTHYGPIGFTLAYTNPKDAYGISSGTGIVLDCLAIGAYDFVFKDEGSENGVIRHIVDTFNDNNIVATETFYQSEQGTWVGYTDRACTNRSSKGVPEGSELELALDLVSKF